MSHAFNCYGWKKGVSKQISPDFIIVQFRVQFLISCPCFSFNADPELSAICTELWRLDENRLEIGKDVVIDLQGRMY